jgi:hypothetical protein
MDIEIAIPDLRKLSSSESSEWAMNLEIAILESLVVL